MRRRWIGALSLIFETRDWRITVKTNLSSTIECLHRAHYPGIACHWTSCQRTTHPTWDTALEPRASPWLVSYYLPRSLWTHRPSYRVADDKIRLASSTNTEFSSWVHSPTDVLIQKKGRPFPLQWSVPPLPKRFARWSRYLHCLFPWLEPPSLTYIPALHFNPFCSRVSCTKQLMIIQSSLMQAFMR